MKKKKDVFSVPRWTVIFLYLLYFVGTEFLFFYFITIFHMSCATYMDCCYCLEDNYLLCSVGTLQGTTVLFLFFDWSQQCNVQDDLNRLNCSTGNVPDITPSCYFRVYFLCFLFRVCFLFYFCPLLHGGDVLFLSRWLILSTESFYLCNFTPVNDKITFFHWSTNMCNEAGSWSKLILSFHTKCVETVCTV